VSSLFELIGNGGASVSPDVIRACGIKNDRGKSAKNRVALAPSLAHYPPMLSRVLSSAVNGIEAFPAEVADNCGWGMPLRTYT
jgi:hypothetical protein